MWHNNLVPLIHVGEFTGSGLVLLTRWENTRKMNGDEKEIKRDSWTSSNTNNFGLIILRVPIVFRWLVTVYEKWSSRSATMCMYFPLQPNMTELPAVVGMYCAQLIAVMLDSAFSVKADVWGSIRLAKLNLVWMHGSTAVQFFPASTSQNSVSGIRQNGDEDQLVQCLFKNRFKRLCKLLGVSLLLDVETGEKASWCCRCNQMRME